VVALAPVSLWAEDDADGVEEVLESVPDAPEVVPEAPLEDLPLEEPLMPELPVPLAPEVSEEPDEPDMPLDEVPLEPEDAPGVEAEVPEPPAMPASLPVPAPVAPVWLCAAGLDDVVGDLLVSVEELCASAIEDTDAITTSDKDRSVVFNVMKDSF
jgi:hypothetical protein